MERSGKTEQCADNEWQKRLPSVLKILAIDGKYFFKVLQLMHFWREY